MNGAWVFLNFMHSLNSNDFLENSINTKHRKMSKFSRKCILENPPPPKKKKFFIETNGSWVFLNFCIPSIIIYSYF